MGNVRNLGGMIEEGKEILMLYDIKIFIRSRLNKTSVKWSFALFQRL